MVFTAAATGPFCIVYACPCVNTCGYVALSQIVYLHVLHFDYVSYSCNHSQDKDYKAVSQWLQSELDSLEARATSIETTLREENDELERKLNTSGKMLTRQKTINHDLLQVQSIIK